MPASRSRARWTSTVTAARSRAQPQQRDADHDRGGDLLLGAITTQELSSTLYAGAGYTIRESGGGHAAPRADRGGPRPGERGTASAAGTLSVTVPGARASAAFKNAPRGTALGERCSPPCRRRSVTG